MLTVMYMQRADGNVQAYQQMPDGSLKPLRGDAALPVPDQFKSPALMQQQRQQQQQQAQQQLRQLPAPDELGADPLPSGSRQPLDVFMSQRQEQQQVAVIEYSHQQHHLQAPAGQNTGFGEPEQQQSTQWQQQQQQQHLHKYQQQQSQMVLVDESTSHASLQRQPEAQQVCSEMQVQQGVTDNVMQQQSQQQGSLMLVQQDMGHISLQQQVQQQQLVQQQQQQPQPQQPPASNQQQVQQQQQGGMMLPQLELLDISYKQSPQCLVQQQVAVQQLQLQQLPGLHQQPTLLQYQQVEQPMNLQQVLHMQQPQQVQQLQRVLPVQQTQHLQQVQHPQQMDLTYCLNTPRSASGMVLVPDTAITYLQPQLLLQQQQQQQQAGEVLGFAGVSAAMPHWSPSSPAQVPVPAGQQHDGSRQLLVPAQQLPLLPVTPVSGSIAIQHDLQQLLQLPQLQRDEYAYLAEGLQRSRIQQPSSGIYSAAPWGNLQAALPQPLMPAAAAGQQGNLAPAAQFVLAGSPPAGLQISSWQASF
jgi:hypothetical protein